MAKITELSQLDLNKTYSYADYLTWKFKEAIELINGKVVLMSPALNEEHQNIKRKLLAAINWYLKDKECKAFSAPFEVRLYERTKALIENQDIDTVVQPDLCLVCGPEIADNQGCNGAPDWIIEILSKGNSKREMQLKYRLYAESGVREYWIVYPNDQAINQFVLDDNGHYQLKAMYSDDDIIHSDLFPELAIHLTEIFEPL